MEAYSDQAEAELNHHFLANPGRSKSLCIANIEWYDWAEVT